MPSCEMLKIKGFIETSFIDWKAGLSSVLFTGGCNFRCPYCHNSDLVQRPDECETYPFDYIMKKLEDKKKWVERVVICGGEPTIHENLPETLKVLKKTGMMIKLDTNGSNPDMLRLLVKERLVDYVAMDVKGPLPDYYKWSGVNANTELLADSISFLLENNVPYEFRMTVVPTLHSEDDVYEVAQYLGVSAKFNLQGFRPGATLDPGYSNIKPFSPDVMEGLRRNVHRIMRPSIAVNA